MHPEDQVPDPTQSARDPGLRYVSDAQPAFSGDAREKDFATSESTVPPCGTRRFWRESNLWWFLRHGSKFGSAPTPRAICRPPVATPRAGSKVNIIPRWCEVRDETKYERMLLFGAALTAIREQVEQDLALPGVPRRKVLATIVRLMETTYIRVGNEEYSRENHSYGLITMRGRYVQVDGSKITFKFQRNSGVRHAVDVQDRRLAKVIRRCQDLPGYELFQYVGDDGETHSIDSADVNDYLGEVSGHDFTAKDFRTWAGTVLACAALKEYDTFDTESQAKKNVVRAIPSVADQLGNTSSVCRKCYVHPAVLES
jgi:DNA topoisomerase I